MHVSDAFNDVSTTALLNSMSSIIDSLDGARSLAKANLLREDLCVQFVVLDRRLRAGESIPGQWLAGRVVVRVPGVFEGPGQ
jgi:hypothetical protein